ncbi:MAG TPA: diacylglycerol kinase family protein [Gemmatimonadales bacterium]|nr:diacylglycerol kinase family protein [Gemmatimonadales bacterium]
MLHAHVILNPAAGRGAARRAESVVVRAFRAQGWAVDVARTEGPGHGQELAAQAVRQGARHVVAVGGDGTVHEVANGLLRSAADAALGVVPVGSGNDFAKLVGVYGHDPVRAVARLVTAGSRRFDAGRVLGEWFVNSVGFGFGPAVVQRRNRMPHLRGFLSYLVPIVQTFFRFEPPVFDVAAPGFRERGYMMMIEVCNGTTAGGSYRFAPDADPADGKMDVCLIRRVSLPRFLLALPRVMRGTHVTMREVAVIKTAKLVVRSPEQPLVVHVDGELREPGVNECTVELERGRLNVLVAR